MKYIVFEEADRTLDMGFSKEINQIIEILKTRVLYFESIKQVLVSATISDKMEKLCL